MSKPSWSAPQAQSISAFVVLPGSKSLTNRELVLSALAEDKSVLIDPLESRDTSLMIAALETLGTSFEKDGNRLIVTPGSIKGNTKIDCGLAGTVMRFLPPVAALAQGAVEFDGDAAARKRPMATTIDSLRKLGVEVIAEQDRLPFTIHSQGRVQGGRLEIDASSSSQFVSGLLLSAARFDEGLELTHSGKSVPSMPHIDMTLQCLKQRGVRAEQISSTTWKVDPGAIEGREVRIEPDLSNAGPFLAAALVAGGEVRTYWPSRTSQVGDQYRELLRAMGAEVIFEGETLTVRGSGVIQGIERDLSEAGELVPTIAALAALAQTPSKLTGIAHLRGHETDRLKALVTEINSLGGDAEELEDGILIKPASLHGGVWKTYEDHRMATAGAIIGLRVPGVEIEDIDVTSKTMPKFATLWLKMLGGK